MNKQQFGYNLGKLYLKLNTFAKQRSQQYHIPYWVMLLVVYSPVILLLFTFPWLVVFALVLWLIIKLADSETQSEYISLTPENSEESYTKFVEDNVKRHSEYEFFFDDK
ncbi:hypothetical protein ACNO7O_09690 [Bisgaard Taxon 45]